ncbi:MAG: hypothetical protein Q7R43_00580 [Candidatus Daviesbacteria bacterium]|nr:hypothetical protein [Candidatus Daviesbacteria bacterium]
MKNILFFLLISFLVIFLNTFPNYYAFINTPKNMVFSGQASWFDPWDINLYVSAINWGQNHGILLSNVYTTVENKPILLYPLYTISGSIFKNTNPYLLFHLMSIFVGLLLLFILWQTIKVFLPTSKMQFIALFLISLGGGIGWVFFPNISSSDLFMTGFTFQSHFQRPHEALGIILYLLSLIGFYLVANKSSYLLNLISLISTILLVFFYPFYLLSYGLICGFYSFYLLFYNNKKPILILSINLFIAGLVLLFYYQHLQSNLQFAGILNQKLSNQNLQELILGWGILLPLIILQLKNPKKDRKFYFLNFWLFISLFLSLLPFGFARFYLRALFLPIIILILLSVPYLSKIFHIKQRIILIILIILVPISSFFIAYKRLDEATKNNQWFYISKEENEALDYLNKNAVNQGILSSYNFGNIIPAKTNSNVYFGHLLQTPNSQEKINNLMRFFANDFSETEAQKFLIENNVNYVVWGKEEDKLKYQFLKTVFQDGDILVFSK